MHYKTLQGLTNKYHLTIEDVAACILFAVTRNKTFSFLQSTAGEKYRDNAKNTQNQKSSNYFKDNPNCALFMSELNSVFTKELAETRGDIKKDVSDWVTAIEISYDGTDDNMSRFSKYDESMEIEKSISRKEKEETVLNELKNGESLCTEEIFSLDMSPEEQLKALNDAYNKVKDPKQRADLAIKINDLITKIRASSRDISNEDKPVMYLPKRE